MITITEAAPVDVIEPLIAALRHYTATVMALTPTRGTFTHASGSGTYHHNGESLTVEITSHAGHFSELLLKGGIRQLIQETVEDIALIRENPAAVLAQVERAKTADTAGQ